MPMKRLTICERRDSERTYMFANFSDALTPSGTLNSEVHRRATFRHELLNFITEALPRWRDDPERPDNTSETALTELFVIT